MKALSVLALMGLIALAVAGGLAFQFLNTPMSDKDTAAVFEVRPGESFRSVAQRLEEAGAVSSATKLIWYGRISGLASKVRVGEYSIRRSFNPREVMAVITSGRSIEYAVTIQEGLNKFEIASVIERSGVAPAEESLALIHDRSLIEELLGEKAAAEMRSLEGYLFPETYHITKFTGARGLIKIMVGRFKENYQRIAAQPGWNKKGLSQYEIVTLASIIEKETGAPEERRVISSVFHNRLRKNMRLQTDPTVIYGIWEQTGAWNRNITKQDLMTPSRYNTYTFSGLPYGPISNPGAKAIEAAGNPEQTDYLFFVSRNDGTHIFSKDYSGHHQAVIQFQKDRRARQGKSWRDLQKREKTPEKIMESGQRK